MAHQAVDRFLLLLLSFAFGTGTGASDKTIKVKGIVQIDASPQQTRGASGEILCSHFAFVCVCVRLSSPIRIWHSVDFGLCSLLNALFALNNGVGLVNVLLMTFVCRLLAHKFG